jgi:HPt (histidine-containing phosphotransfer) domain-containing protein
MAPLDPETARHLREDLSPEVLRSIVQTFEADMGRLALELLASARAGDMDGYHRAAHSIAGAASAVGASQLEREARMAMDPHHHEAPNILMPRLMREAGTAIQALRQMVA